MTTWLSGALCFAVLQWGVPASWALEPGAQPAPDAEQLYKQYCQQCHEGQVARAPHREVMSRLPANLVLHSLSVGKMRMQGWVRTIAERRALSEWITGKKIKDTDETVGGFCEDAPGEFSVADGAPQWNGWGVDNTNSRFQSAENAGIPVAQVPQLKVKWVFGLPMDFRASQPTVVGGRVFVGSCRAVSIRSMPRRAVCTGR